MIARPSLRFALVLAAIFAASPAVGSAYAEDTDAFRKLGADEAQRLKAAGGYIIGDYGLSAPAISAIRESKILAKAVKRIETVDWKKKPFTKLNAELTIRQRMDHYLASSIAFYTGKAKLVDTAGRIDKFKNKYKKFKK